MTRIKALPRLTDVTKDEVNKEYSEEQKEWLGATIGEWKEHWEYRSYQRLLSPEQFKRAEILYAKYSREWVGIDEQTRQKWLRQMTSGAPQWQWVFVLVTHWFNLDAKVEEGVAQLRQWKKQQAEALAKAQAEAKERQQREQAEAAARQKADNEAFEARWRAELQIKCQQKRKRVAMRFFGISLVLGFLLSVLGGEFLQVVLFLWLSFFIWNFLDWMDKPRTPDE
jgi:hypothetical protein